MSQDVEWLLKLLGQFNTKIEQLGAEKEKTDWEERCKKFPEYATRFNYEINKWETYPLLKPSWHARVYDFREVTDSDLMQYSLQSKQQAEHLIDIMNDNTNGGKTVICKCGTAFYIEFDHI